MPHQLARSFLETFFNRASILLTHKLQTLYPYINESIDYIINYSINKPPMIFEQNYHQKVDINKRTLMLPINKLGTAYKQ